MQVKCIVDCYKGTTKGRLYSVIQCEDNVKEIFKRHRERYILRNDFGEIVSIPKMCFEKVVEYANEQHEQ